MGGWGASWPFQQALLPYSRHGVAPGGGDPPPLPKSVELVGPRSGSDTSVNGSL